ncbi:hypothetical protein [Cerasicoccus frondis]|uniref:hypothetical protein n=1 Tax=Cerasicoccus frondis TaxID=490090 RepID=UPI00285278E6|nr:hypothetical protein [Cerasicoccus frondis]
MLTGLVISVQEQDKTWEGKSYKQLEVGITNGKKTWFFRQSDTQGPLPAVAPFTRATIEVQSAQTEKGNTVVRGVFLSNGRV